MGSIVMNLKALCCESELSGIGVQTPEDVLKAFPEPLWVFYCEVFLT